jgi:hypothetical protein
VGAPVRLFRVAFAETEWLELLVPGSEQLKQKVLALGGASAGFVCLFFSLVFLSNYFGRVRATARADPCYPVALML